MTDGRSSLADKWQMPVNANRLYGPDEIDQALEKMAIAITRQLQHTDPIVMPVMIGGIIPAGKLIPQLGFPLQIDYVHVTRYQGGAKGHELEWFKKPTKPMQDKTILLIDDILDEGLTLAAIIDYCRQAGAGRVYTAVLAEKQLDRLKPLQKADFSGLTVPDRYVFGGGMDYREYHRNLAGIYALSE